MKYFVLSVMLTIFSFSAENHISLQYTSLKYKDHPLNDFISIYGVAEDRYSFISGGLDIRAGITVLGILKKSGDFDLFPTIEKSKALVHSLSVDYYPSPEFMLSLGRQSLDINLLRGSFDGIMAVGDFDDFSLKTFYFKRYAALYPYYYKNEKLDKLYGFNLNYNKGIFESEVSYFSYYDHWVDNVYIAIHPDNFSFGVEHLGFHSKVLSDEKAYKLFAGYRYDNFYLEVGHYHVYEGRLRNIYALGGTEFKTFRLHGFLDQLEAKNIYADLQYKDADFYAKLHLGYTSFEDKIGQDYSGKEIGVTLSKRYKDFEFSTTVLTQKSDQAGSLGERSTWVQAH
ncbi:MAG: hypothetical protein HF962_07800, partial [Sulfurovum sp.]|nr:hypothetical protein [Sulfurovum sp.]